MPRLNRSSHKPGSSQTACGAKCITTTVSNRPASPPAPVTLPNIASYTYTLKAPLWTPDRTGFLMAVAAFTLLIALFQYFSRPSW